MKTLKYPILLLLLTLVIPFLFLSVSAESESLVINLSPSLPALTDGRENASVSVTEVTLTAESEMQGIYILYYDTPTDFTVKSGEESAEVKGLYLRRFFSLSEVFGEGKKEVTLTFASSVRILEIYAFSDETPSWVQKWEEPCEKADLCLMTTHADDEQLFFAGVLPYYAGEKDFAVQVVYFTDHKNEPLRRHELLNGLWTVGVENYPVISPFPDLYSESESAAQSQFQNYGFSREDVVAFQVEMLRRFRPLVVIGHDPEGEYGHGQHRLNSATLQEAVTVSGDATAFPESAETYGTWEVPKTYLHLYGENKIVMDWDVPLSSFEGKTAFQVTQEGFLCHASQQYTWFRRWLNGNNGEITKASQITTHSPCEYGLFLSRVGEDVLKNDFFENLKTWEQQRLEEEARLRAEEEAKRKAEEERLAAEEAARQKAEEASRLAAEEKRLAEKLAEENRLAEEIRTKREKILILMGGVLLLLCVFGAMIFYNMKKKD